jgi:transposase
VGYIYGEGRHQGTLFPVLLDDLIPGDHVCRVIDAFVNRLNMADLGFERAEAAETGRPGYDPRDLLKLYLYGYLNQIRSSRRLEAECLRNVELMWLLGRLNPDHKSIAEFRRMHREALTAACSAQPNSQKLSIDPELGRSRHKYYVQTQSGSHPFLTFQRFSVS